MLKALLHPFFGLTICLFSAIPSFSQTPCDCVGAGTCPLPINDNLLTTIELPVNLPGAPDLATCPLESVCITITHTWIGDLSVSLISPNGEHYLIMADVGNDFGQCGTQQDNAEFCITTGTYKPLTNNVDYACNLAPCSQGTCCLNGNWTVPCGGVTSPLSGATQAPGCDLNAFNLPGAPANGIWTLVVNDVCNMDVGILQNFSLNFGCGDSASTNLSATTCAGETILFNGQELTASGEYVAVFPSANGCDSTVALTLEVLPQLETAIEAEICEGESFAFGGLILIQPGLYELVLAATNECDSILSLNLVVNPVYSIAEQAEIEFGSNWQGVPVFSDTTIVSVFATANGCDSTVTVQLSVLTGTRNPTGPKFDLLISPNPFDASATLEVKGFESGKSLTFKLLDVTGRLVQQQTFRSPSLSFSRNGLPSGMYFVKVEEEGRLVALGRVVAK